MFFLFQGGGDMCTLFLECTFSSKLWRDMQRTLRSKLTLTLSMSGFQKLAQAGGRNPPPPLNSAPLYLNETKFAVGK